MYNVNFTNDIKIHSNSLITYMIAHNYDTVRMPTSHKCLSSAYKPLIPVICIQAINTCHLPTSA